MKAQTVGGNGFYIASLLRVNGTFMMYAEAPINDYDYGPIALYTASQPEGPWTPKGTVLVGGDLGDWSAGDMSESKVCYNDGIFHLMYSAGPGPARNPTRRLLGAEHEEIGYAFSFDGIHFQRSIHNPVATRSLNPGVGRMSEAHVFVEDGIFYVYHTIAWINTDGAQATRGFVDLENLGVEILVQSDSFRLPWPALQINQLQPGKLTEVTLSSPLNLDHVAGASFSIQYRCTGVKPSDTREPFLVLSALTSNDGVVYDTGCQDASCPFSATLGWPSTVNWPCDGKFLVQEPLAINTDRRNSWISRFPGRFVKFQLHLLDHGKEYPKVYLSDVLLTATLIGKQSW